MGFLLSGKKRISNIEQGMTNVERRSDIPFDIHHSRSFAALSKSSGVSISIPI